MLLMIAWPKQHNVEVLLHLSNVTMFQFKESVVLGVRFQIPVLF